MPFFKNDFFHIQNLPGLAWGEGHGEGDSGMEKMLLTHSYFIIFLCVTFFSVFWVGHFSIFVAHNAFPEVDLDVDDADVKGNVTDNSGVEQLEQLWQVGEQES